MRESVLQSYSLELTATRLNWSVERRAGRPTVGSGSMRISEIAEVVLIPRIPIVASDSLAIYWVTAGAGREIVVPIANPDKWRAAFEAVGIEVKRYTKGEPAIARSILVRQPAIPFLLLLAGVGLPIFSAVGPETGRVVMMAFFVCIVVGATVWLRLTAPLCWSPYLDRWTIDDDGQWQLRPVRDALRRRLAVGLRQIEGHGRHESFWKWAGLRFGPPFSACAVLAVAGVRNDASVLAVFAMLLYIPYLMFVRTQECAGTPGFANRNIRRWAWTLFDALTFPVTAVLFLAATTITREPFAGLIGTGILFALYAGLQALGRWVRVDRGVERMELRA